MRRPAKVRPSGPQSGLSPEIGLNPIYAEVVVSSPIDEAILRPPRSLSSTSLAAFQSCALAFRFATIDQLPKPPSADGAGNHLVRLVLQRLLALASAERTPARADRLMTQARVEMERAPRFLALGLGAEETLMVANRAGRLLSNYFRLENPQTVEPIGLNLTLNATGSSTDDGADLRDVVDRLELDSAGGLVITDYRTGVAPRSDHPQGVSPLVQFHTLVCQRVLGKPPSRVQILFLGEPAAVVIEPNPRTLRAAQARVDGVWAAVNRSCERNDFRPQPSGSCEHCVFNTRCPAFAPVAGRRDGVRRARR